MAPAQTALGRTFGARLRALRRRARLSQAAVARALGASKSTVRRWESGRGVPRFGELAEIAAAVSARPYELLLDDEAPQEAPVEIVRLAERLARERPDLAVPAAAMLRGLLDTP